MKLSKRERMVYAVLLLDTLLGIAVVARPEVASQLVSIGAFASASAMAYVGGDSYRTSGSQHAAHKAPSYAPGSER